MHTDTHMNKALHSNIKLEDLEKAGIGEKLEKIYQKSILNTIFVLSNTC